MISTSAALAPGAVGTCNEALNSTTVFGVNHGNKKPPCSLISVGPQLRQSAGDARVLQSGELHRQRFAFGRDKEKPLTAIVGAGFLHHITFVDQLLEHAAERLLG